MTDASQIESQIADLTTKLAAAKESEAATAHFHDSDGNPITDKGALTDAMLVSAGVAMESRARTMEWQERSVSQLEADMDSAMNAKDYIAVALYAAMLNASKVMSQVIV